MNNLLKSYHVASDAELIKYFKTKRDRYDYVKYTTFEQLMVEALNKYKVLLTSIKWNTMSLEQ